MRRLIIHMGGGCPLQASMIDSLVSRHIDALSDWEEHLARRKTERTASYRPNANGALGRKGANNGVAK